MSCNIPYEKCEDSEKVETKVYKKNFEFRADFSSSYVQTAKFSIVRPTFRFGLNEQIKCNLEIQKIGCFNKSDDYFSVYLYFDKLDKLSMQVEVNFYILDRFEFKKYSKKTKEIHDFLGKKRIGFDKFITGEKFYQKIYGHSVLPKVFYIFPFTIGCEISITYDIIIYSKDTKEEKYSTDLIKDISRMLESSKLSDCIIKVDGINMNVHKFMLASRSEVFLSIFNDKDDLFESNIIEIDDFRLKVVKEMITYIYTGNSPNLNEMASELLMIATKYNLTGLKSMAENSLCDSINIKNVCDYVDISEIYTASILKKCCMTFIYKNAKNVVESEKWTTIAIKYPFLLNEVLKYLVKDDKFSTNK